MANILVLVPMKTGTPAVLLTRAHALLDALIEREWSIEAYGRICFELGDGRPYSAHAEARNAMLDAYLKPTHTHVLWIDADVVDYPTNLASLLLERDPFGIIAPTPLIEGSDRFYDVYGFIKMDGSRVDRPYPPYPNGPMQSVGTCYLAPASIYHAGARYAPVEGHTEHYSVCRQAPRVSSTDQVVVYHANLPKWGERWHDAT